MGEPCHPEGNADRPRIEEITRVVLSVLADWERAQRQPQSQPQNQLSRRLDWLSQHWVLVGFCLSILGTLIAWAVFHVSPLQPLEEIAHRQAEYRRTAEQRVFKRKIVQRHLVLGKSFLDVGQYKSAASEYTEASKLDEADTEAQMGLFKAQTYEFLDAIQYDPEVVLKRIQFIQQEHPKDPHALVLLGDLYARLDAQQAMQFYQQARAIDPAVAAAAFGLGILYHKQGKLDEALGMFEQAVERSPWNPKYLNNLAYLYYETQRYTQAITTYERILDLDAEFLLAYHEVANVHRLLNSLDKAWWYQERLVEMLEDKAIATLEKNQSPWYFVADASRVSLYALPEKQCLAYYGSSVTLFLLGRTAQAEDFVKRARDLRIDEEPGIRALVEFDLRHLQAAQPQLADRIAQYKEKFLRTKGN